MINIAGVVILYYPDKAEVISNITSYISVVDILYVIDNTGVADLVLIKELESVGHNIEYITNAKNEGIGIALNQAASLALAKGCTWLLTMDQDSYFEESQLTLYIQQFLKHFNNTKEVAVVAPSYLKNKIPDIRNPFSYKEVNAVITSGALVQLNIWAKLKGYDENLFIDEVDHEYCYRAIQNGYRVMLFEDIYFEHAFGKKKSAGYFGQIARRNRIIHSPSRVYFMVRNYLYVRKKYRHLFPKEFKIRDRQVLTSVKNNLFFSGDTWGNFKSVIKGVQDFLKYKFL